MTQGASTTKDIDAYLTRINGILSAIDAIIGGSESIEGDTQNGGTGQAQEEAVTPDPLATIEHRLNAHQGLIQFLQGEVGSLKVQLAGLLDPYTAPERMAVAPPGATVITED